MPKVRDWEKMVEALDQNPDLDFVTGPGPGKRVTPVYQRNGQTRYG